METITFTVTKKEFKKLIKEAVKELNEEDANRVLLSKNQARKEIGIGYEKLNALIENKLIKIEPNRKILRKEINRYLDTV